MKRFFSLALLLFIASSSFSQTVASAGSKSASSGLLWEVSGEGLKESSYLFGTYHLVGKSFLDTLPGVMQRFKKASLVVGEIEMVDEATMAQQMLPLMMLQGTTLDQILSAEEFAEVDAFLKSKMGASLSVMNQLKPSAVYLTLVAVLAPRDVSPTNPAIDKFFQDEAKSAGKQVQAFESLAQQAEMMLNGPMERQKELLLMTVRESERMQKEGLQVFNAYRAQNTAALGKYFADNRDMTAEEKKVLLTDRNTAWMAKMPGMMKANPTFFAVGAAHLLGDHGLLELLKKAGYTVKALPLK